MLDTIFSDILRMQWTRLAWCVKPTSITGRPVLVLTNRSNLRAALDVLQHEEYVSRRLLS
jgi:hypothetical protein